MGQADPRHMDTAGPYALPYTIEPAKKRKPHTRRRGRKIITKTPRLS